MEGRIAFSARAIRSRPGATRLSGAGPPGESWGVGGAAIRSRLGAARLSGASAPGGVRGGPRSSRVLAPPGRVLALPVSPEPARKEELSKRDRDGVARCRALESLRARRRDIILPEEGGETIGRELRAAEPSTAGAHRGRGGEATTVAP
jgi:hypothetical protein